MTHKLTPLRTFFCDKDGKMTIAQPPNLPLILWAVFAVVSHLLHPGQWVTVSHGISKAALITWAILEIYSGASYFRRVLGLVVLAFCLVSLWK